MCSADALFERCVTKQITAACSKLFTFKVSASTYTYEIVRMQSLFCIYGEFKRFFCQGSRSSRAVCLLRLSTVLLATLQLRSLTTSWCCNTCFKIIRIFKLAILTRLFQIQFLFVSSALSRFAKNNSLIKVCEQRTCKRSNGSINQEEKRKSIGGWLKGKCNPHGSNLLVTTVVLFFGVILFF